LLLLQTVCLWNCWLVFEISTLISLEVLLKDSAKPGLILPMYCTFEFGFIGSKIFLGSFPQFGLMICWSFSFWKYFSNCHRLQINIWDFNQPAFSPSLIKSDCLKLVSSHFFGSFDQVCIFFIVLRKPFWIDWF
jgi:hypothetical protein